MLRLVAVLIFAIYVGGGAATGERTDLEAAFAEFIIRGPGSFVITADGDARFAEAVRRKLLLEIAGVGADPGQKHFLGYAKPGQG